MPITVVQNLSTITEADSVTGWLASQGTTAADTGVYREATASIATEIRTAGIQYLMYTSTTTWNLSSTHIYAWLNYLFAADLQTESGGGIRIRVTSSSVVTTNYGEWYVGGSDTYGGGWRCFVQDTAAAFNSTGGTPPSTNSIVGVGFSVNIANTGKNVESTFVDVIRYGDGVTVYATDTNTYTMQNVFDAVEASTNGAAAGIIRKEGGVYFVQGKLRFGDTAGTNSFYFSDSNQIIVFEDANVASNLYEIVVQGNSTGNTRFQLGTSTGSGSSQVGSEGVLIKAASTSLPFIFNAASNNINELKLYGSTLVNPSYVYFGNTSTALGQSGSTIHLIDNDVVNPTQIIRNISTSATKNSLRNSVVSANSTRASINLYDGTTTANTEWTIIEGAGFENSSTPTTTTVIGEPFANTAANKPYVSVQDNASALWNLDDTNDGAGGPMIVTDQTEIAFDGNSNGTVNERFSLNLTVQQSDGTAINRARTFVFEGFITNILPSDNKQSSNSSGTATSKILKRSFVPSGAATLTTTQYGGFALRVYKYTFSPFVSSLTVTAPITQTVTLVSDAAVSESDQAAAIVTGDAVVVTRTTGARLLLFSYDDANDPGNNVKFTIGQTVTGATSGHSGTVVEVSGTAATGKIIIRPTGQSHAYIDNETINGSGGTPGVATLDKTTTNDSFTWEIDANTVSLQNTYNYLSAHMAQRRNPIAYMEDSPSAFTDFTPQAASLTTNDVNLMPSTPATNDAFYFGDQDCRFEEITIVLSTAASTSTINWQYSNGAGGWTNLSGVTDGTNSFTQSAGTYTVGYTLPSGSSWGKNTVNATSAYWVRALQTHATPSGQPKATTISHDIIFERAIEWGEAAESQLLYSGALGYFTNNAILTENSVDEADSTTGWTPGTDSAVSLNSTQFKEPSGAINLNKTGTTGDIASADKTTTSRDFTLTTLGLWIYLSTNAFNNLRTADNDAINIRFGSNSSNYYTKQFPKSSVAVGWNFLSFDKYTSTSMTGSPTDSACNYTRVAYRTDDTTDTTSAGDFIFDDIAVYTGVPQGVYVGDRGAGEIQQFTADFGATLSPELTVTLEVNNPNPNFVGARIRIEAVAGGPLAAGTQIMSEEAINDGGVYRATESFTYTGTPQPVLVRARLRGFLPFETTGNITSAGLTVTAIWQVDAISDSVETT